ncbi:MAG: VOC family protein [Salinirussus sp.]
MNVIGLDRIVIATEELRTASAPFSDLLGLSFDGPFYPTTETGHGAEPLEMLVSAAGIEIITPKSDDGQVARFLATNGPGLYAMSIRVGDLDNAVSELAESGHDPVGEFESPSFRERFYHPDVFGGALLILAEYDAPHGVAAALSD